MHEEVEDTWRQHSQLTAWYCLDFPLCSAELKVIFFLSFLKKAIAREQPAFFGV